MCAGEARRWPPRLPDELPVPPSFAPLVPVEFLGPSSIVRSLILFNLLFAAQSILDGLYLWGHVALPANMTYAAYAHRGAYPLIATALLAAVFVLAAMRPGGPAEKSKVIRPLVYLWVGQNILLVASSILRLDLYVDIYMLTYWRIAAFIWMGLVALGLVLIVARIALDRSNRWLVGANLIALTIVLYSVSLVNFDAFIADYNLTHSSEMAGKGVKIDANYLLTLGPQALPALDKVDRGFVAAATYCVRTPGPAWQKRNAGTWPGGLGAFEAGGCNAGWMPKPKAGPAASRQGERRDSWRIAFSSSTTKATSARSSVSP